MNARSKQPNERRPSASTDEVRALERWAMETVGLPGAVLMENAGSGAARLVADLWAESGASAGDGADEVWILTGGGNNGGDGWVVARHLVCAGLPTRVLATVPHASLRGDAALMARAAIAVGVPSQVVHAPEEWRALALEALHRARFVVDALLGIGAEGPPRGPVDAAIRAFAAHRARARRPVIVALDLPSGLEHTLAATQGRGPEAPAQRAPAGASGDPSLPPSTLLAADHTCTFAAVKPCLLIPGVAAWVGAIHLVSIGIPVPRGRGRVPETPGDPGGDTIAHPS